MNLADVLGFKDFILKRRSRDSFAGPQPIVIEKKYPNALNTLTSKNEKLTNQ